MDAPNTSTYLLLSADSADLPNSRVLSGQSGMITLDTGSVAGEAIITATGRLGQLAALNTSGYLVFNQGSQSLTTVHISNSDGTISVTNGDGTSGSSTILSVVPQTSVQLINTTLDGASPFISTQGTLNFVSTADINISVADNPGTSSTDITLSTSNDAAPSNATYILQTPNSRLTSAQALSELGSSGLLKTVGITGEIEIASPISDYMPPSENLTSIAGLTPTLGTILIGDGTGFTTVPPPPVAGLVLVSRNPGVQPNWSLPPEPIGTVTSVGLTSADGTISITATPANPIESAGTFNVDIAPSGVVAGSYYNPSFIDINEQGQITQILNGQGLGFQWFTATGDFDLPSGSAAGNGYICTGVGPSVAITSQARSSGYAAGDTYKYITYQSSLGLDTGIVFTLNATGQVIYGYTPSGLQTGSNSAYIHSTAPAAVEAEITCLLGTDTNPGTEVFLVTNYTGTLDIS